MRKFLVTTALSLLALVGNAQARDIVHDAEFYILEAQNGERWSAEDAEIDAKLAELRERFGQPPNIVYILWDDTAFGAVGFPGLQKNYGYDSPNLNKMAAEGINCTRMYTEPSCT
ncbi:MAG: sulfatase-like hydrolase/transferase, partial [Deltaproteobacteria bacterium]|nr:sulfatase-like hydrolase/transferase [Deltaproteobacteria bacterium]